MRRLIAHALALLAALLAVPAPAAVYRAPAIISALPLVHPGFTAGRWYTFGPAATAQAGAAATAGLVRLTPVFIPQTVTINALGAKVTTAATSGNFQLALYTLSGSLIVSTASMSTGTAGNVSATITNTQLQPGWYFAAVQSDNATAVFASAGASAAGSAGFTYGAASLAGFGVMNNWAINYTAANASYGTWPSTLGTISDSATASSALPVFQVASVP